MIIICLWCADGASCQAAADGAESGDCPFNSQPVTWAMLQQLLLLVRLCAKFQSDDCHREGRRRCERLRGGGGGGGDCAGQKAVVKFSIERTPTCELGMLEICFMKSKMDWAWLHGVSVLAGSDPAGRIGCQFSVRRTGI